MGKIILDKIIRFFFRLGLVLKGILAVMEIAASLITYLFHTSHFVTLYLLVHGLIKFWLVVGLLREKIWYYPVSLVVFTLFIAYQMQRYTRTHSPWLIAFSVLDVIVILLTWREWHYFQKIKNESPA